MWHKSRHLGACLSGVLAVGLLALFHAPALAQHHGGGSPGGFSGGMHGYSGPSHVYAGSSGFSGPHSFAATPGSPVGTWSGHHDWDHYHGYNPYWGWGWGGWWGPGWGWGYPYAYDSYWNGYPGPYVAAYGPVPGYPVQTAIANPPVNVNPPTVADPNAGLTALAGAIAAFKQGDYKGAISQAQQVAAADAHNAAAHQLIALALLATGDYRGAAAEMHTALTLGPPIDWTGIYTFYGNDKTYTDHLRALERYTGENPQSADAHFLLGFQYGATGNREQAIVQLKQVVQLNANDQMASRLLTMLQQAPPPGGEQGSGGNGGR